MNAIQQVPCPCTPCPGAGWACGGGVTIGAASVVSHLPYGLGVGAVMALGRA